MDISCIWTATFHYLTYSLTWPKKRNSWCRIVSLNRKGMPWSSACWLLLGGFLRDLPFDSEDRGGMFLQNVGDLIRDYMVLHPRR
jgi:hypothetical protein